MKGVFILMYFLIILLMMFVINSLFELIFYFKKKEYDKVLWLKFMIYLINKLEYC